VTGYQLYAAVRKAIVVVPIAVLAFVVGGTAVAIFAIEEHLQKGKGS
jgi:uncharacterized protein YneF (UPF0154 family)